MKLNLLIIVIILFSLSFSNAQSNPQTEWEYHNAPHENGWDMEKINEFRQYIIDSTHVTGLMIVHQGKVVLNFGDTQETTYIASCRKSILSLLYGKYVKNSTINLKKTIEDLTLDDVKPLLPIEKKATVEDLISARSGIYLNGVNKGDFLEFAPKRGSVKPGSYWLYNNWDFNIAGYIFESLTSKNIYDEITNQLAIPLQMQDWDRSIQQKYGDEKVSKFPAYHMWFSTRDMARVGLLLLNDGKWNNKQVIAKDWIAEVLKERSTSEELLKNVPILKNAAVDFGYGYMWWLWNSKHKNLDGAYSALGYGGQSITIYPNMNTVIALKTKLHYGRINSDTLRQKILIKIAELYENKK